MNLFRLPHNVSTIQFLSCLALSFIPQILSADNSVSSQPQYSDHLMPEVIVEAEKITPTTGTVILDRELIETLPIRNGNINELIGHTPGVQFNEDAAESTTQGEIRPPLVSITGSRYYDNNYTIDGIGNNNPLDPASDSFSDANKLPGYPQIHLLSPHIIDQIVVYNTNIPAEFGGFIGGQVDASTLDPEEEFWGKINYRTTRSNWTQFHIDPLKEEEFKRADTRGNQPNFKKQEVGATLNLPLNPDTGILLSYQQQYSQIPLYNLAELNERSRRYGNYFIKLQHYLPGNSKLTLTALSSPRTESYFLKSFKDSNYSINNDNHSLIAQYDKVLELGEFAVNLGYTDQTTERKSATNRFFWNPSTASIDWDGGKEGGIGDLETGQRKVSGRSDMSFNEFHLGQTGHQIKIGFEMTYSRQRYDRPETSYYYYSPVLSSSVSCDPGDIGCIDNEQYFRRRLVYNESNTIEDVFDAAAYIQDIITWKRLELFPGLRIAYDDFTEEEKPAPRLSVSLDVFGNRSTILFAGQNRYYSGTLLTHSLYQAINTTVQSRTSSGNSEADWSSQEGIHYLPSAVKTPYADEQTIGLIQRLFGGDLKLQYTSKLSKNEFARDRIDNPYPTPDDYMLNNLGRSEHESFQVSWQRSWQRHHFEFNATWQKTTSSHTDYDTTYDAEDTITTIWYEGEELSAYEIPRRDFNRPHVINLLYSCELPYNVTFTNVTKLRGAYWRLWNTLDRKVSERYPDQTPAPYIYEKRKSKSVIISDWHFRWQIPSTVKQQLVLTADILNVFDKRTKIAYQTGTSGYDYEVGRQIWAGIEFNF